MKFQDDPQLTAHALGELTGPEALAMEKLMGMILVTISVQMIMTGLRKFLAG